ncbi:hypothetical protein KSC_039900 [Ktedonobacter sp. SOSP1-52]|nr:hypothetical protein KSC_039900 [Ktedonobacter sp. SOSP1-52]
MEKESTNGILVLSSIFGKGLSSSEKSIFGIANSRRFKMLIDHSAVGRPFMHAGMVDSSTKGKPFKMS